MTPEEQGTENLFSYGTLQTEEVQLATFGRKLQGTPDALPGYTLTMVRIRDRNFAAAHGSEHRNLQFTGMASDLVEGTVFTVTEKELEQADRYEPLDYRRLLLELRSGISAWVYLNRRQ